MNIRTLLTHRCSLIHKGQVMEQDDYGQDVYGDLLEANVPCRLDKVQNFVSPGDTGDDFIQRNTLFVVKDVNISLDMRIRDITDTEGNMVLDGEFKTESVNPIYNRKKLNHFEITMKKV